METQKYFVVGLLNEKTKRFQADNWEIRQDGHLVFKRGANSFVAMIASDKWIWFTAGAEEPDFRLADSKGWK